MLNIQQEIQALVHEHDFLVLPSIGAFISEYSKPYFDNEGSIVLPEKTISFNHLIDRDVENKLFHIISRNKNISVENVQSEYYSFLVKFRSEIVLNQKFTWEDLGTFYKNDKQELVFYPQKKPKYIPEPAAIEKTEVLQHAVEKIHTDEPESKSEFIKRGRSNYVKALLYAIPLILISTTLAYTIFIKPSKNKSEKKNLVEEIDSLSNVEEPQTSETPKREARVETKSNENKSNRKEEDNKEDNSNKTSGKNHIVGIGIFKVKDNVDNLAAYLAENGIPAKVRKSGNRYRLFVTASSPEQANEFVQKIEQLTGEKAVYENN
jgi:cell division septation protein DedD